MKKSKLCLAKGCTCGNKRDHFPGYPNLKRVTHSDRYGRMELIDVTRTSDGYLIGTAKIGEGENSYIHSVFIG